MDFFDVLKWVFFLLAAAVAVKVALSIRVSLRDRNGNGQIDDGE